MVQKVKAPSEVQETPDLDMSDAASDDESLSGLAPRLRELKYGVEVPAKEAGVQQRLHLVSGDVQPPSSSSLDSPSHLVSDMQHQVTPLKAANVHKKVSSYLVLSLILIIFFFLFKGYSWSLYLLCGCQAHMQSVSPHQMHPASLSYS